MAPNVGKLATRAESDVHRILGCLRKRVLLGALLLLAPVLSRAQVPAGCARSTAGSWENIPFSPDQAGVFSAEYDFTPETFPMNGHSGLSNGPAPTYNEYAATVRFNSAGMIEARNGPSYSAVNSISYSPNVTYRMRIVARLPEHTYSVWARPSGGAETLIARDFAFRDTQAAVASLNNLGVYATNGGTELVCGLTVNAVETTPPVMNDISVAPNFNSATVRWSTDELADAQVEYGTSASYGQSTSLEPGMSTSHAVKLSGLSASTLYHYRVKSYDAVGNQRVSNDATFITPADSTAAKAPQRFLSPALVDNINDIAEFGPQAQAVSVYDLRGSRVFQAERAPSDPGIVWRCRSDSGQLIISGVYIARIDTFDSQRLYQSFVVVK